MKRSHWMARGNDIHFIYWSSRVFLCCRDDHPPHLSYRAFLDRRLHKKNRPPLTGQPAYVGYLISLVDVMMMISVNRRRPCCLGISAVGYHFRESRIFFAVPKHFLNCCKSSPLIVRTTAGGPRSISDLLAMGACGSPFWASVSQSWSFYLLWVSAIFTDGQDDPVLSDFLRGPVQETNTFSNNVRGVFGFHSLFERFHQVVIEYESDFHRFS
jgi:hypothetical protein